MIPAVTSVVPNNIAPFSTVLRNHEMIRFGRFVGSRVDPPVIIDERDLSDLVAVNKYLEFQHLDVNIEIIMPTVHQHVPTTGERDGGRCGHICAGGNFCRENGCDGHSTCSADSCGGENCETSHTCTGNSCEGVGCDPPGFNCGPGNHDDANSMMPRDYFDQFMVSEFENLGIMLSYLLRCDVMNVRV
jgi:hypothetical protein